MEEFPPNSSKSKESEPIEEEPKPDKQIEKVISGDVVRKKKPLGRRLRETFITGDSQTVVQYIFAEVVIPAAKDMLADAATSGVERLLFGEGSSTRRGSRTRNRSGGYYNYSSRYSSTPQKNRDRRPPWQEDRPRPISKRARTTHDFQEIILNTRSEAETVIERMFDLTEQYETATVSDLYDLLGIQAQYTDNKWGWYDVRDFHVRRVREGYLLDIPKPEPLD